MHNPGDSISCYPRPDLIRWVLEHCVHVPHREDPGDLYRMTQWCEKNVGKCRPGNILDEARTGWLDYHEGEWCDIYDNDQLLLWFCCEDDRALFTLTWL